MAIKTNVKYCGYARVSVKGHSESIQAQKESIRIYAKAHGWKLTKIYVDDGISAYKLRPAFNLMMKRLDRYEGVIVTDLTRFGRNTSDLLFQLDILKQNNTQIIFVKQNIDTSSKEGVLLLNMLSAIADFERSQIRERLEAGKEWARINGTRSGKPMHRPKKTINWKEFDKYNDMKLSIPSIAKILGVSKGTLYTKIKEREVM